MTDALAEMNRKERIETNQRIRTLELQISALTDFIVMRLLPGSAACATEADWRALRQGLSDDLAHCHTMARE